MTVTLFGGDLYERVLATAPASLLAYFRLTEGGGAGGGTAANAKPAGAAGTYGTAVNRGAAVGMNGYRCPTFSHTASTDYVDILSSLGGWNGNLFSILIYGRIPNAGDWTDAALNFARLIDIRTDANNSFYLGKYDNTTNSIYLSFELKAAGVGNFAGFSVGATTSDFSVLITNNQAANRFRIYFNGAQVISGATPGLWSGALTTAYIGASYALFSNWKGYLYDCAVWSTELTAAP